MKNLFKDSLLTVFVAVTIYQVLTQTSMNDFAALFVLGAVIMLGGLRAIGNYDDSRTE